MSRPGTPSNTSFSRAGTPGPGQRGSRGHACLTCRQRRIRCDGRRPICVQCERQNRAEECEYPDSGPSPARLLEENIRDLEIRLRELHAIRTGPMDEITLYDPYAVTASTRHPSGAPRELDRAPNVNWWSTEKPPLSVVEYLVDAFLPYALDFGFFLNEARCRSTVLAEAGRDGRSSVLLTAMCLCAVSLLRLPSLLPLLPRLQSRAMELSAYALSSRHPDQVTYYIQADILLAHYSFSHGRFLEGRQRLNAVTAVSVACGLHRLRSSRPAAIGSNDLQMPPVGNAVEEGERILAFWTVVILDKSWAVAMGDCSSLPISTDRPESQVDTPWPLSKSDYEAGRFMPTITGSLIVENFLRGASNAVSPSILAVHAKAAILWERSYSLGKTYRPDMPQQRLAHFVAALNSLDMLIATVARRDLPRFFDSRDPAHAHAVLATHSIIYAACVQLHRPVAEDNQTSRTKMLMGAKEIFSFLSRFQISLTEFLNPILGPVWLLAANVLAGELMRLRKATRIAGHDGLAAAKEIDLLMTTALGVMRTISTGVPLLEDRVSQVQDLYTAANST